jgi:DNA repair photolyase
MRRRDKPPGRGSLSNPANRFDQQHVEPLVDEWDALAMEADQVETPSVATVVSADATRSILSRNDSPDVPFDRSINPYKGCEHGCIYCFARPTHAYLGLSPGLDFETHILSKPNAAALLRATFARASYRPEPIAVGANTDPYQPAERRLQITRELLQVFVEHRHPVGIITKSDLVKRDIDLLAELASRRLAHVFVSITTLDGELARRMEPRASAPQRRLAAVRALAEAGVPVGVLASPMIPALNDHELEGILEAAAQAGAERAGTILVRLPHEVKQLFEQWLERHYPLRAARVLARIREARGGELYRAEFGERMRGRGPYAELIQRRFAVAVKRYGLSRERYPFDTHRFVRGERDRRQLRLF